MPTRRPLTAARRGVVVAVAALLAASACSSTADVDVPDLGAGVTSAPIPRGEDVAVDRVVDGDTVVVDGGTRVRLIGIDTPESVTPDRPVECFGLEAAAITRALIPPGTLLRLEDDQDRFDRFGRRLAYLYRVSDGLFVNATLVAEGAATTLTIKPNTRHSTQLAPLEDGARASSRGLWGACP